MQYLSAEWLDAATEAMRELDPVDAAVSVGFVVGEGAEAHVHRVELGPERIAYLAESGGDVILHLDATLASEIARGEASAQRAFLDGRIRIDGDVRVLTDHASTLAAVDDRLAALRAETEFDDPRA